MIGHGRPTTSWARPARLNRWLRAMALAHLLLAGAALVARAEEATLKLRIAWGGGAERLWHGTVSLSGGTLSELEPLGIEADEPGSIWLDGAQIRIRQPSPRAYDGIDVLVTADLDARLTVWLSNDQGENPQTAHLTLRELVGSQPFNTTLDDTGNRLFVSRSPGDRMRVEFDREHLVFAPGESFTFAVRPYQLGESTAGLTLEARIATNPGDERVWSHEYRTGADGTETSITIRMPEIEGVYDLTIAAARPSTIKKKLHLQKPLALRKIQFVVLASQAASDKGEPPTSRVVEINPVNPRWWERFANLPLFGAFPKGPLGNGDAKPWNHPALGTLIQLGPGGAGPDISWEAYPLPIDHPGQVHVLEIEYPTDVPQAMGISLLEPNAAGAVMPIGLDSGVYVSDAQAAGPPRLAKHRVVFWPRTRTPLLLVTNRRAGSQAVYGKITVLSAARSQFSVLTLGRAEQGSSLPPAPLEPPADGRLWAGYMDRPLVPENFGAPEALDGQSYSLDDWNTFYRGGVRLVNYLKHVGYGGLMLSVLADGSTVYPSQLLEPTPRYDTGAFFVTGQDPRRKDALEMYLRLFDRGSLVLIPALQFAAPLPELEALKRAGGPEAAALEWIGEDGRPWLASNAPRQGLAPYYNLLDPRVQQAMLNVAGEVLARYGSHDSFGGLALQLSPDGYALLPGAEWGYDDATISRFERETRVQVPGSGAARFNERAAFLCGPGRETWVAWRAAVVADFHRRLARQIAARHPGAKLYLAGGTMLEGHQTRTRLRPTLPHQAHLDEAMRELGVNVQAYRGDAQIVVLRPRVLRPQSAPSPAQALENEIYLSSEMDLLFGGLAERGGLFYHEPQKARLASFDAASPFGAANTYAWLVSQMSPSGNYNRRRFAHLLAVEDSAEVFDGGWLLPLGQEQALVDMLAIYRQLPAAPFQTVAGDVQPLTIRTLTHGGKTFVYLVNDSPWQVKASLQVDAPPEAQLEMIGAPSDAPPMVRSGAVFNWDVALAPYGLVAARISTPGAHVRNPLVTVPPQVRAALQSQIDDFVARVAALGNPRPLARVENAGFELPLEGDKIPGWTAGATAGGRVALDARRWHSGQKSIMLASTGGRVSITSAPFDPPKTGRLWVEVRLRTSDVAHPPSVRIGIEGELPSGMFEPHGVIPVETSGAEGGWTPYWFPVDPLPGQISNVRVRLELMGPGEVWIDDVQVFDLRFTRDELIELSKIVSLASVKLEQGQYADCVRLLEGYWPQYLVANVELPASGAAPVARRADPAPPRTEPEKKPSMLDTIRNYFR